MYLVWVGRHFLINCALYIFLIFKTACVVDIASDVIN